jgi:hypothetical protein
VKALASGNPLVLEKAGIDTELAKLSLLKSQWDQQQWRNKQELAALPKRIETIRQRIAAIEADIAVRQDVSGNRFAIEIDGKRYTDRAEAGNAILHAVHGVRYGSERVIGRLAGFPIVVKAAEIREFGKQLLIRCGIDYEAGRAETPIGFVKVLENTLNRMELVLEEEREYLARTEKRMADIQAEVAKPFDKAERLTWLQQRQREIDAALDLTKGDLAAAEEAEVSEAA